MFNAGLIAHAQWFVDPHHAYPVQWQSLGSTSTIAAVGATTLLGLAIVAASRSIPPAVLIPFKRLAGLVDGAPRLIGVTLGLGLIGLSVLGSVLAPSSPAATIPLGAVLIGAQAVLGAWLVLGLAPGRAALGVMAFTAIAAVLVDPIVVLQAAYVPASAMALLALAGTGSARASAPATVATSLRLGMGVALIAVAMTEKLAAPAITETVLGSHPELNVLAVLGIGADPETFTLAAGCVEILLGLLLLAGTAPQVVALAVLFPFVATLPLFGVTELVGHLPIYGTLLTLAALAPLPVVDAAIRVPASAQPLGST